MSSSKKKIYNVLKQQVVIMTIVGLEMVIVMTSLTMMTAILMEVTVVYEIS